MTDLKHSYTWSLSYVHKIIILIFVYEHIHIHTCSFILSGVDTIVKSADKIHLELLIEV